jgi:hypothetical protein
MLSNLPQHLVHDAMPTELKKALEIYSVAMQRHCAIMKRIPPEHQPKAFPPLKKPHSAVALHNRTELLHSRYWRMERQITHLSCSELKDNRPELPPHLRVLLAPAGPGEKTKGYNAEIREYPQSAASDQDCMKVSAPWERPRNTELISV